MTCFLKYASFHAVHLSRLVTYILKLNMRSSKDNLFKTASLLSGKKCCPENVVLVMYFLSSGNSQKLQAARLGLYGR